jgi:AraC family transcriptional regulator
MADNQGTTLPPPRITDGKPLLIAGLGEHFTFETIGGIPALWQRFQPHLGNVPGQIGSVAYGICHNTDEAGSFDYTAGVEVAGFATLPAGFARLRVAPRRYAVFTHAGHVSGVRGTFMAIFNDWLPRSGFRAADAPAFERYDERFDGRTGLGGFEVWIPIDH